MRYNGKDIITKAQLKNTLSKYGNYEVIASNIRINGTTRGCSGFVTDGNRVVYFTTERVYTYPLSEKAMYRIARNTKDYSGGHNRWCDYDRNTLAYCIVDLLENCKDVLQ